MNREIGFDIGFETSRLLAQLDRVLAQSRALREIARRRQLLADLERMVGSNDNTCNLRNEIRHMEQQLRRERHATRNAGNEAANFFAALK